jgi:uncharacterized protein (DUF427 family)
MRAKWQDQAVAESETVRRVGGYVYFPREAVRMDLLKLSPKTARDLECPHGVQFYDLVYQGAKSERAAWSYEAPQAALGSVAHWIGFWQDVEVG